MLLFHLNGHNEHDLLFNSNDWKIFLQGQDSKLIYLCTKQSFWKVKKSHTWRITSLSRSRDFWFSWVSSRSEAIDGLWHTFVLSLSWRCLFASSVKRIERNCRLAADNVGHVVDKPTHVHNISERENTFYVNFWKCHQN